MDVFGATGDGALWGDSKVNGIDHGAWDYDSVGKPGLEAELGLAEADDVAGEAIAIAEVEDLGVFGELAGVGVGEVELDEILVENLERACAMRGRKFTATLPVVAVRARKEAVKKRRMAWEKRGLLKVIEPI